MPRRYRRYVQKSKIYAKFSVYDKTACKLIEKARTRKLVDEIAKKNLLLYFVCDRKFFSKSITFFKPSVLLQPAPNCSILLQTASYCSKLLHIAPNCFIMHHNTQTSPYFLKLLQTAPYCFNLLYNASIDPNCFIMLHTLQNCSILLQTAS